MIEIHTSTCFYPYLCVRIANPSKKGTRYCPVYKDLSLPVMRWNFSSYGLMPTGSYFSVVIASFLISQQSATHQDMGVLLPIVSLHENIRCKIEIHKIEVEATRKSMYNQGAIVFNELSTHLRKETEFRTSKKLKSDLSKCSEVNYFLHDDVALFN